MGSCRARHGACMVRVKAALWVLLACVSTTASSPPASACLDGGRLTHNDPQLHLTFFSVVSTTTTSSSTSSSGGGEEEEECHRFSIRGFNRHYLEMTVTKPDASEAVHAYVSAGLGQQPLAEKHIIASDSEKLILMLPQSTDDKTSLFLTLRCAEKEPNTRCSTVTVSVKPVLDLCRNEQQANNANSSLSSCEACVAHRYCGYCGGSAYRGCWAEGYDNQCSDFTTDPNTCPEEEDKGQVTFATATALVVGAVILGVAALHLYRSCRHRVRHMGYQKVGGGTSGGNGALLQIDDDFLYDDHLDDEF